MSGTGDNEADGSERDGGDTTAYRRLRGELTAFRTEFERLIAETPGEEGEGWHSHGRELLDQAEDALADGKIEQGWHYLHAAKRLELHGLEAVYGEDAKQGEAREILVEARNASLSWRSDAVEERLTAPGGSLRDDLTWADLRAARSLLHEGYQRVHLKRKHLQAQFWGLWLAAAVSLVAFLLVGIVSVETEAVPGPFVDVSSDGSVPAGFLVYVLLSGMLGASLFGLWSLRTRPTSTSTPQYLTGRQTAVARAVVGAGSALAVFFFLHAELLAINTGPEVNQGPLFLALAFVAGYSERFVHSTVETVASLSEAESRQENVS